MLIVSQDSNVVVNMDNIKYVDISSTTTGHRICAHYGNDYICLGEYRGIGRARLELKRIIMAQDKLYYMAMDES